MLPDQLDDCNVLVDQSDKRKGDALAELGNFGESKIRGGNSVSETSTPSIWQRWQNKVGGLSKTQTPCVPRF